MIFYDNRLRWPRMPLLAFAVLLPGQLFAQPVAGKVQPNRLDFGTVRAGATVEGSVRVFQDFDNTDLESDGAVEDLTYHADPPDFAFVNRTDAKTQRFGNYGTKIVCDVFIGLSTGQVGRHSGVMSIDVGGETSKVLVSVTVLPADDSATSVLVIQTPFERFSTDDATLFNPWLDLVKSASLDVHYLDVVRDEPVTRDLKLDEFDLVLLGEVGVTQLRDSDVARLKRFVHSGGRLIVFANRFFRGTVGGANKLLAFAGLTMIDTERQGKNNLFKLTGDQLATDPFMTNIQQLSFFRPSPIVINDKTIARILVQAPFDRDEGLVAVGQHGQGQVIGIGQSLWWNWISNERHKGSQNQRFLQNLITQHDD